ncbi:MAG: hypothetical protein CMN55_12570 [Sneathiella sp.]|mgnify:FL=1|jgi:uncharacterized protein YdeI (YjbR/CyaY-like superfamily)|uniref:YdeI/OmpD-associated family protein n=1 Tax=Sneathiella sp. TaxID=1964365 RepID=UPI000C57268C|nr:DUF1801 domain-containing protein [Sneathiella sp.]MAL79925.1 hypothetical protein [Sneathiella sp.]|tara:strand:- start:314 stop:895 length:582 start_codon:yes stop_codon:yes gene_type:complete
MNKEIEALLNAAGRWQQECRKLRAILNGYPLVETVKWGKPSYTYNNSNLVMIYALKDASALGFFKGALMTDPQGILQKPGENSQAMRWAKFTGTAEIEAAAPTLKSYIGEAIALEKAGATIDFKEKDNLVLAAELQEKLASDAAFRAAFKGLTPGRQRGYNLHFSGAKQAATRVSRIEKCTPRILAGKGLHDR